MITLTLEYWQDDNWFVGRIKEIPDCFSQGETLADLENNLAGVYKLMHEETDIPAPPNTMIKPLLLPA